MTTYELTQHLHRLLRATDKDRHFVRYIFVLARAYDRLGIELMEGLTSRNRTLFSRKHHAVRDAFYEVRRQSETFSVGQIFHELIQLREEVRQLTAHFEGTGNEQEALQGFATDLHGFYEAFEQFVRSASDEAFGALMRAAHHLHLRLQMLRQVLRLICAALDSSTMPREGCQALTLLFEAGDDYARVLARLQALEAAYRELVELTGITEPALAVQRLEVDRRMRLSVEGEARLIEVLTGLLERYVLFRTHLDGSADDQVGYRVGATQSLINLVDALKQAGLTDMLDDEPRLKSCALELYRALEALVSDGALLQINERHLAGSAAYASGDQTTRALVA
ncbi:hypothetical protein Rhom172_0964 [Rhodothermus marinus SG0.5JP17-172]|mgnify:FL=1|uniref:hypothetical protein n=1 Tax=Rhodothermus marinus TaxID=29549 RepID=UPI000223D8AC|nr:hypothetical protein [Rhodothermus marinus]AEN72894.1 hypothetical protein Rhom172_0964 [Rhodothermus marinus SG0.5JP17-172]